MFAPIYNVSFFTHRHEIHRWPSEVTRFPDLSSKPHPREKKNQVFYDNHRQKSMTE